ncbi:MAG: carboxypeptidase regulatory-like domain-containing protein, partial [Syntrophothermus sp.]
VIASPTGKPVQGALVQLRPVNPIMSMAYSARTDSLGQFKIINVVNQEYYIMASAPGYVSPEFTYTVKFDNNDITNYYIKLLASVTDPVTLTGHVWENQLVPYGKFIPAVMKPAYPAVITLYTATPLGETVAYTVKNREDGSYEIKDVKPGTYNIKCEAEKYQPTYLKGVVINQNPMTYDIYLLKIFTSSISGSVTFDKTGLPLANAKIGVFPAEGMGYGISVPVDKEGNYSVSLPEGKYIVSCTRTEPGYYYTEYYDNVQSSADAKVLILPENTEIKNINFGIPDIRTEYIAKIRGSVKDEKGAPVPYALVKLWFRFSKDSVRTFVPDSIGNYFVVKADMNGVYETVFKKDMSMLNEIILSAERDGYMPEFYNNKPYYYLADKIIIAGDTVLDKIDFSLTPKTVVNTYSVSGVVTGSTGLPINGAFVVASSTMNGEMSFAITGKDGKYQMTFNKPNKYYLLFAASGFIPEFYNKAYIWEKAMPVGVNGPVTGINAELREIGTLKGSGSVSGVVTASDGLAVSGALITLNDASGIAVASAMTDGNGSFQITDLPDGHYALQISKVNFESVNISINVYSAMSSVQVANVTMNKTATEVKQKEKPVIPQESRLIGNYPNPFNPSTRISFSLSKPVFTNLAVYNLLGQEVEVLVKEWLNAGTYDVEFSGARLPSGIYIYKMQAGEYSDLKKMILVK